MTKKKEDAVAVWQPKEFAGNDLLPIDDAVELADVEGVPAAVLPRWTRSLAAYVAVSILIRNL